MSSRQQPPFRRSQSTPLERNQQGDIYQQLIESSDMVKELDDIEAISQQISQHAEVLYQSWKNNGMTTGPGKLKLQTTPPLVRSTFDQTPSGSSLSGTSSQSPFQLNGVGQASSTFPRRGYQMEKNPLYEMPPSQALKQNGGLDYAGPSSSRTFHNSPQLSPSSMSGLSSPSFITSKSATLPGRSSASSGFDQTDKSSDVEKSLDLLAAPEVNGSLKELVNSFVSTDRAKQAARQTISNTINNITKSNGGFRSGSLSSSSSPFSSRAVSPLRSPMLAAGASSGQGLASLTSLGASLPSSSSLTGPLSPTGSSTSSNASSTDSNRFGSSGGKLRTTSMSPTSPSSSSVIPMVINQNVHTKMPSIFSNSDSNLKSQTMQNRDPIPIPVQHVGSDLRSPSVLSTIKAPSFSSTPTQIVKSPSTPDSDVAVNPIASMHLAHVDQMKKRFEEAKQRMSLIHERALLGSPTFDRPDDLFGGGTGSDTTSPTNGVNDPTGHSSYLFDQFRRRIAAKNKPAAPPHPELTPQQRQHIFERTGPSGSSSAGTQQPNRRIMSGGSVAERVMIFERCPPVFANSDLLWEGRPFGSGGFPPGVALTEKKQRDLPLSLLQQPGPVPPWRSLQTNEANTQALQFPSAREIPISQTGQPASSSFSGSAPAVNSRVPTSLSSPSIIAASPSVPSFSPSASISSTKTPQQPSVVAPTVIAPQSLTSPAVTPILSTTLATPALALSQQSSRQSLLSNAPSSSTQLTSRVPQPKSRPTSIILTTKDKVLPKFHFPYGDPAASLSDEIPFSRFTDEFRKFKGHPVSMDDLGNILKACGYPVYWKSIVCIAAAGEKAESVTYLQFAEFWRKMITLNHDEASQFVYILAKGNPLKKYLMAEDFVPLIQEIVDTHPGLGFLKEATEFHSRYVHTVIARIFFMVNRSWSGKITINELRKSNFLATLRVLELEDDINQISNFFSYEHFYVIYCKFWELDKDHDLFIDREDLARHNDHAISTRMIDRIFSGAVTRGPAQLDGKMSYTEFVWFLLAEEDKRSQTSIEYWFRCMDLDGDGYLSMYELEYFYEEQLQRMEQLGIETLPFEDCLCQMLDMIGPKERTKIRLSDLKTCRMTPIFFDTFFNLEKYLDHEQRDPFASSRDIDEDGNEMSDWDRFAAEEYELLVAEEGSPEDMNYDDDNNHESHLDQALENDLKDLDQLDLRA